MQIAFWPKKYSFFFFSYFSIGFSKININSDPFMCTHINIGIVLVEKNKIVLNDILVDSFEEINKLKNINNNLKVLMWIGGPSDSSEFEEMIQDQSNRIEFIQSIKSTLRIYRLDGIDLDWEFPVTSNHRRLHFSQLIQEIRMEYKRHDYRYLLSVAVAALEGIAFFAYDIQILNENCDYVNIMCYDYHFYSKASPFTGTKNFAVGRIISVFINLYNKVPNCSQLETVK